MYLMYLLQRSMSSSVEQMLHSLGVTKAEEVDASLLFRPCDSDSLRRLTRATRRWMSLLVSWGDTWWLWLRLRRARYATRHGGSNTAEGTRADRKIAASTSGSQNQNPNVNENANENANANETKEELQEFARTEGHVDAGASRVTLDTHLSVCSISTV